MGAILVILSALGFSTLGVFGKFAYEAGFTRNQALAWRFGIAIPFMFVILALTGSLRFFRDPAVLSKFRMAVLLGMVGIGIEATLYFLTLEYVGAALTGVLLYLYPAFVALISHFFLKERLGWIKWLCILLSLVGCFLIVDLKSSAALPVVGVVYGVLTAVWYAAYLLTGNRLMKGQNSLVVSTGIVTGAFLSFFSLSLIERVLRPEDPLVWLHLPDTTNAYGAILGLALLASVLPFTTLYAGMKRIGATKASILSTLEMVFTIILAALFLQEKLTPIQLMGAALILISVLLIEAVRSE